MALNLEKELRLEGANLTVLYEDELDLWKSMARRAYEFTKGYIESLDDENEVRPDDVIPHLRNALAVTPTLRTYLASKKLRQQYWYENFAELIIDRLWATELHV